MEPNIKKTINDTISDLRQQLTDFIADMKYDEKIKFVNAKIALKKKSESLYQFYFDDKYVQFKKNFMDKYHFIGNYRDLGTNSSGWNMVYEVTLMPDNFFNYMLRDNLVPEIGNDKFRMEFSILAKLHEIGIVDNNCNADTNRLKHVSNDAKELIAQLIQSRKTHKKPVAHTLETLLKCDEYRIGVKPYNEKILENPNQGHWDIDVEEIINSKKYFGRDPHDDIKPGVVGIDFGTKSTIVYYRSEKNTNEAMPIGGGDEFDENRFENPTIMEFVSIDNFLTAYNQNCGRPETNWKDLMISHKAKEDFNMAPGAQFNAYIDNLKQWAAGRNNKLFLVPTKENGKNYKLKPFAEVDYNDINPIEYYAYLIGLFVNRMNQGVYLSYYLSQPVKLEKTVKDKIKESFENGIKKSLPDAILDDDDTMRNFQFNADITEPMAYAVCALQQYQLEPEYDKPINYAIFDFGGGTTDFDFGQWCLPDDEDDSYKIITFGGSGMPYMGGENLLEDLAAKIFIDNKEKLVLKEKSKKFQFQRGPTTEGHEFDPLVADSNSVYASRNMHKMMEALRPYWQESESMLKKGDDTDDEITLSLELFDTEGNSYDQGIKFTTSKSEIEQFFKNRICEAINNFFVALHTHKDQFEGSDEIKIFLAGNSCKSPYVTELFNEKINQLQNDNIEEDEDYDDGHFKFEIFPSLGTTMAREKMERRGISLSNEEFRNMPTGKTGVAYGLLECRKGSGIQIDWAATRQDSFEFIIGRAQRRMFKPFADIDGIFKNGKPTINGDWFKAKAVKDGDNIFELKFTKLPEAISGNSPESVARTVNCNFDTYHGDGSTLWMKAIGPHTLAYAVADCPPYDEEQEYQTIELNETR